MLVTFIQGVVRSLDKHLSPFDEASGEEPCDHANDYFLRKRGVHRSEISSTRDATAELAQVTKIPTDQSS
jgi:hypothetical protein